MLFANNCNTTLNGGITAVATSMVVTSATGFPAPTGSQYFYCTLADAATQTTIEIVKVTAVSGTTFTIVRGQDGTSGTAFASGAVVSLRLVRASLNDFPKLDETNTFTQLQTINTIGVSGSTSTTPVLSFNASNCPIASGTSISGSYLQFVLQNTSGTAGASTNYVLSNDLGTDSTYYGEFGMNSSVYSSGTPADFFSINNGIYYSGHDGDITLGSGNGKKLYLAWGTSGQSAHVINASGAIGLNTNLASGTGSGTTNFGTAGQVLTSQGSSSTPTWTTPTTGTVTSVAATAPAFLSISGSPITGSGTLAISYSGTALPVANGGTGLTTLTANYIPFGNGTSAFGSDSSFTWNTSSKYLFVNSTASTGVDTGVQTLTITGVTGGNGGTLGLVSDSLGRNIVLTDSGKTQVATYSISSTIANIGTNTSTPFAFNTVATERMRIFSSGGVSIGNTTDPGATNLSVAGNIFSGSPTGVNATTYGAKISAAGKLEISQNGSGSTFDQYIKSAGTLQYFLVNGSIVGSISATTSLTLYNTTSDYRLKNVIGAVTNSGERIDALEPIEYEFKTGGNTRGFLAHKFAEVYPSSVSGKKDAIDADGNPVYQAMQASSSEVMADLIAEIQSLRARLKAANIA